MYLSLLTEAQKRSFLAMAQKVILADGKVMDSEETYLNERIAEMGIDIVSLPEEVYGESNTAVFDTPRSRLIVLMELYILIYADGDFASEELAVMQPILDAWGMTETDLDPIRLWAQDAALPAQQGWEMLLAAEG